MSLYTGVDPVTVSTVTDPASCVSCRLPHRAPPCLGTELLDVPLSHREERGKAMEYLFLGMSATEFLVLAALGLAVIVVSSVIGGIGWLISKASSSGQRASRPPVVPSAYLTSGVPADRPEATSDVAMPDPHVVQEPVASPVEQVPGQQLPTPAPGYVKNSGIAIAGFVLGIIGYILPGIAVISIVLCCVAFIQIKEGTRKSKGFAWWGIGLSLAGLVSYFLKLVT